MKVTILIVSSFSILCRASTIVDAPVEVGTGNAGENASCPFFGHWVLDPTSWPTFPLSQMRPITLRPEDDKYRLVSRIDNLFSTLMLPEGPDCNNKITETRTIATVMLGPNYEAEGAWTQMLENIRRVKYFNGKLIIWFSEGYEWKRIEFLRSGQSEIMQ